MTEAAPSKAIPWTRILVEGVVIVGSILLAFGIDAMWDARQERQRTERHLQALIREVRQTQDEIRLEIRGVNRGLEGSRAVLELIRGDDPGVTPEQLADAIAVSMNVGIFTAPQPVLTTLLTSGELLEFGDDSLLSLLGGWRAAVEHLRIDAEHLERNREEVVFERAVMIGVPIDLYEPSPAVLGILSDPGMDAAFALRALRATLLGELYADALETSDEVIQALERALEK